MGSVWRIGTFEERHSAEDKRRIPHRSPRRQFLWKSGQNLGAEQVVKQQYPQELVKFVSVCPSALERILAIGAYTL